MAVVINDFEASVDRGEGSDSPAGAQRAEMKPPEFRRQLRRVAMRAARIRAG